MATSLSSQLKQLAIPSAATLRSDSALKEVPSLVYKRDEAARIDRETIFALGHNGFLQLINIDTRLESFEAVLFSESAKNFERTVESKESNEELNKSLDDFLLLLSPHFHLRPAQKVLEWLIRRFYVHQFNVDSLMKCCLPHHESRIFVAVVQLLNLPRKLSRPWAWLRPVQETSTPLARHSLIVQTRDNPRLLAFLIGAAQQDAALRLSDEHNDLWAKLYSSTLIGCLSLGFSPVAMATLLPALLIGFRSPHLPHRLANYMLVGQLSASVKLKPEVAAELVKVVSKYLGNHSNPLLPLIGLQTILCLCKHQTVKVSHKTSKYLSSAVGNVIELAADGVPVIPLVAAWIPALLRATPVPGIAMGTDSTSAEVLISLLRNVVISFELIETIIQWVAGLGTDDHNELADTLMSLLETKYPKKVDRILHEWGNQDDSDSRTFRRLVQRLSFGLKHRNLESNPEVRFSMGMIHPEESVRGLAVRELCDRLQTEGANTDSFLKEALLNRLLCDDSPEIVETIGGVSKELVGAATAQGVYNSLILRISQLPSSHPIYYSLSLLAIQPWLLNHLTPSHTLRSNIHASIALLSRLLLSDSTELQPYLYNVGDIIASLADSNAEAVKVENLRGDIVSDPNHPTIVAEIIRSVRGGNGKQTDVQTDGKTNGHTDWLLHLLYLSWLTSSPDADPSSKAQLAVLLVDSVVRATSDAKFKRKSVGRVDLNRAISTLRKESSTAVQFVCMSVTNCILNIQPGDVTNPTDIQPDDVTSPWVSQCSPEFLFMTRILSCSLVFALNATLDLKALVFRCLTKRFVSSRWFSGIHLVRFATLCLRDHLPLPHTVATLRYLHRIATVRYPNGLTDVTNAALVPSLLIGCSHSDALVREVSLELCAAVLSNDNSSPYRHLLELLVDETTAVVLDSGVVVRLINSALETIEDPNPSTLRSKKRRTRYSGELFQSCWTQIKSIIVEKLAPKDVTSKLIHLISGTKNPFIISSLEEFIKNEIKENANKADTDDVEVDNVVKLLAMLQLPKGGSLDVLLVALEAGLPYSSAVLGHVTSSTYKTLEREERECLFEGLVDVATRGGPAGVELGTSMSRVEFDVEVVNKALWESVPGLEDSSGVIQTRRKRVRTEETPILNLDRLKILLEMLNNNDTINSGYSLIPAMFRMLHSLLRASPTDPETVDYLQQLVLGYIIKVFDTFPEKILLKQVRDTSVQLDLVVACFQGSRGSRDLHTAAIQLLCRTARFYPELVLHGVTSIFTFMGDGILHQDNAYSIQLIHKCIQSIVPLIVSHNDETKIIEIVSLFVDCFQFIPKHRRLSIFTTLISSLSPQSSNTSCNLSALIVALIDKSSLSAPMGPNETLVAPPWSFITELAAEFGVDVLLETLASVLDLLMDLPHDLPQGQCHARQSIGVVDLLRHQLPSFHRLKLHLCDLPGYVFKSQKVVELFYISRDDESIQSSVSSLLETVLKLVAQVNSFEKPSKFIKTLQHKVYNIVQAVYSLLTCRTVINVTIELIHHGDANIRKRAIEVINNKLSEANLHFKVADHEALTRLVPEFLAVAKNPVETEVNKQLALIGIKLASRVAAGEYPVEFLSVLETVSACLSDERNANVRASMFVCIGECVAGLGMTSLPLLPVFIPPLLSALSKEFITDLTSIALLATSRKVAHALPSFMTPYLVPMVTGASTIYKSLPADWRDKKLTKSVHSNATALIQTIGEKVSLRVLVPAIESVLPQLMAHKLRGIELLTDLLSTSLTHSTMDEFIPQYPKLTKVFTSLLDFRSANQSEPLIFIEDVENLIFDSLSVLLMKSSESSFRPFYYSVFEWSSHHGNADPHRLVTFYRLSGIVAVKLSTLFPLFANIFMKHACKTLGDLQQLQNNLFDKDQTDHRLSLIIAIIQCLHSIFIYDHNRYLDKPKFDALLPPLLGQLVNQEGGEDSYTHRMREHVVPCVAQLAVSCYDDSWRRRLNQGVLELTKNTAWRVRLSALRAIGKIHELLGEDYMTELPECIPYIAELLEDEEPQVEDLCKQIVVEIEKTLGEPINKYF